MSDIDTKQPQAVDPPSAEPAAPSSTEEIKDTAVSDQGVDTVEEIKHQDEAATLSVSQDEFSDAIDDTNEKTAQDLTNVITALQGTVLANLPKQEPLVFKEEDQVQDVVEKVLDTIPEMETSNLGSSLINNTEESSPTSKAEEDKADIDISLNDNDSERRGEEDIHAASGPSSPRPQAASVSDLKIATHFEQIRNSIDVPAGQNMADFVTPPTPGLAPPSILSAELGDHDDDNDDDLQPTRSESAQIPTSSSSTDAAAAAAPATTSTSNVIPLSNIDFSTVRPNHLTPRAQEKFGKHQYNASIQA